nr:hypothetical protein Iba_chr07dCG11620 [Ipomoea batatas]
MELLIAWLRARLHNRSLRHWVDPPDTSQVQLMPFGNSTKSPALISTASFDPPGYTFTFPFSR